jgi:hypothetical protein
MYDESGRKRKLDFDGLYEEYPVKVPRVREEVVDKATKIEYRRKLREAMRKANIGAIVECSKLFVSRMELLSRAQEDFS